MRGSASLVSCVFVLVWIEASCKGMEVERDGVEELPDSSGLVLLPAVDSQDKLLRHAAHDYIVYGMIKGTSFFSVFLGFLFGVWVVTLWILSSLPGQDIYLPPFPEADKAAHFGYFFIGGFLLAGVLRRTLGWRGCKLICVALCAIALIGALDELHQLHTRDRSGADPADWM